MIDKNVKMYTAKEAAAYDPATDTEHEDLVFIGWLWRDSGTTVRWFFTLARDKRTYPVRAQFVPVFARPA